MPFKRTYLLPLILFTKITIQYKVLMLSSNSNLQTFSNQPQKISGMYCNFILTYFEVLVLAVGHSLNATFLSYIPLIKACILNKVLFTQGSSSSSACFAAVPLFLIVWFFWWRPHWIKWLQWVCILEIYTYIHVNFYNPAQKTVLFDI